MIKVQGTVLLFAYSDSEYQNTPYNVVSSLNFYV